MEKKYYIFNSPYYSRLYIVGADTMENAIEYFTNSNAEHKLKYQLVSVIPQTDAFLFETGCRDFEYL